VATFTNRGTVSVQQGELVTFPATFQSALLLFDVNNAPKPDNWTTSLYAIQKWDFNQVGVVRAKSKVIAFDKSLVRFMDEGLGDFELELRLVNWLPYATVEIWEVT
jgi:hypothetical protein